MVPLHGKILCFSMNKINIEKKTDCYWGYAYLRPQTEKKVAEKLGNAGILCYLPVIPRARMMHYTKVVTEIPMFKSYIFLCLGRYEAADLKIREKQIIKIDLQFEEAREDTLIYELRALQQCEELAKSSPVLINPGIRKGDKVRITDGPLKDLVTDVIRREDERDAIIVNVSILGQHIEYPVSAGELKKITQ